MPTLVHCTCKHKKAIRHNLLRIQNEHISLVAGHSKELLLVQENHATGLLSDRVVTYRGMKLKTSSESRIELQNLLILKKRLEKASQFLLSE